ncbi:Gfo/Idh/MocA family protein [Caldivirga sp. UBA161]|uniref:Gfo/Idh/MocA family protein n=1 Tax=Caldivirga sp. UBA161 TaxID=1915569 RepID=UPI0025BF822A|nr:Gfo/Idh/MocA family oxidoreductase [Caldivirga sp. UBA161]
MSSTSTTPQVVKVGFVGCGGIVQGAHAPSLAQLPNVKLVACADVDKARVAEFLDKYKLNFYTDYKEMLAKEVPDAVVIATPNALHAPVAIDALESGAHVLTEKPMAINVDEAVKMVEAARRRQRVLMVGHHMRFERSIQVGRKFITNGRLGKIYHIRALHLRRRGIPSTVTFLQRKYSGGGPMWDIGVHTIDATMFMANFPKPVAVVGKVYSAFSDKAYMRMNYPVPMTSQFAYTAPMDVEDFAMGLVKFEDGLTMYIEATWATYIREDRHEIAIMGTEGGIHYEGGSLSYIHSIDEEFITSTPLIGQQQSAYAQEDKAFIDAITKGAVKAPYPACTGEQGVLDVAIIEAIYKSAESGREEAVNIPKSIIEAMGW